MNINIAKVAMWLFGYLFGYIDIQISGKAYLDIDISVRIYVDIDMGRSAESNTSVLVNAYSLAICAV